MITAPAMMTAAIATNIPIVVGAVFPLETVGSGDPVLHPGLGFLMRAAARLTLVEASQMGLDEAIADLVPAFEKLRSEGFDELVERPARENKVRRKRERPQCRPTPEVVVEAMLICVRERGVAALKEPINKARLKTFDSAARAELQRRLAKLAGTNQ
jgi:hypothetical protein